MQRALTCRLVNHPGDRGSQHPRSRASMLARGATGVRADDGLIVLMQDGRESIVDGAGFLAAWSLLQQDTMSCGISAMHADHAVDQRLDTARAW